MGPPISTWPYSHPSVMRDDSDRDKVLASDNQKCFVAQLVDNFRVLCLNFTFALLLVQVLFNLNSVIAGPVILNLDYVQGPVPLARNIRHLPCISRRTGQEGLCMFAIDCLKANGSHLGTCIDRFYFGSCCQIPDKTILPQIIGNNIEDNSIDSANFVHPQTEDKITSTVSKIPDLFPNRKVTTERVEITTYKSETVHDRTEAIDLETKSDEGNIVSDKPSDNKLTTVIETTTKSQPTKAGVPDVITEVPIKLSTFQTVSGDINNLVTEESKTEEAIKQTTTTQKPTKPQTTRKPTKPTYKPRPSYRPTNFTRPPYVQTTLKPRPTKPIVLFNNTRKPPYRLPPKRNTTKKPLPSPPRLNITIIPQSTSSRPVFTRPSLTSITYINTTLESEDKTTPAPTTTSTTTTTTTPTTTTTTTTTTTSTTTTTTTTPAPPPTTVITTPLATERLTETAETATETTIASSTEELTEKATEKITTASIEPPSSETPALPTTMEEPTAESSSETVSTEADKETTAPVTEKETIRPATEADVLVSPTIVSTEYPPLVTWSTVDAATKAPVDGATKAPENITTTVADDKWSPITPPEGWVLISTIPPTSETTTTTTTTTTTEAPTTILETSPLTTQEQPETTEKSTEETTTTKSPTTVTTTTTTETTTASSSESPMEFTVNVTLSPTMPTSTASVTSSAVDVTSNVTQASNVTEATTAMAATSPDPTTESATKTTTAKLTTTTQKPFNMTNYKEVCGRRLWPQARIVGGEMSAFGQWPWQISLRQYRTATYLHKCGAALLNENWAITAAHCVEHVPPSELLLRLGEHDLSNEKEPYGFAERRVQIIASHPHFDPATFEYDLALLRFYEPVTFQPNILPICVPDTDDDFVGKTAYVTGWGRLYDDGPLPSVLQEVQVPVINNTLCEAMYQDAGYNEHIPNIFICAGRKQGGTDSCEGDSGGPMVVQRDRDNRFVLGGVISWGIGCAEPNQPGVYTRISEFRDWINQILQF